MYTVYTPRKGVSPVMPIHRVHIMRVPAGRLAICCNVLGICKNITMHIL